MAFKDRMKIIRQEKGLSTSTVAADLGKSHSAIRMWESGNAKPDIDTLVRIAEYFGCTTDYLLGLTNSKAPSQKQMLEKILDRYTFRIQELDSLEQKTINYLLEQEKNEKRKRTLLDYLSMYLFAHSGERITVGTGERTSVPGDEWERMLFGSLIFSVMDAKDDIISKEAGKPPKE